ncbi:hypothetical protein [Aestuariivivens sediminicola]|uniref:hypothetical protein n=1 Tax=Aestuariivivens sediminicola TaxID=2913560 RepID=UPI001F57188D|nr:hypothetical protein [Aestuariivivens sediminicola]
MKTLFITLTLVLSFTLSNAQSNVETTTEAAQEVVTPSTDNTVEIDTAKLNEAISKTSDIKNYLNMERKVDNIKLVFPKIHRRKIA